MMPDNEQNPSPSPVSAKSPARSYRQTLTLVIAVLAFLLAGAQWLDARQKQAEIEQRFTQRLGEAASLDQEERGAQKQLRSQIEDLQARLGAFEGKLNEFQAQGTALQSLYQDLSRSREEAALLEIEQAVTLAAQQLQLAGNVPVAQLALQTADARLARLDKPLYLPLRKAVAHDLARLNALPFVDVPGISLRLEEVIAAADKLPLAALGRPAGKTVKAVSDDATAWWQRLGGEVWQELKGLVRIQRFDREEPALLAPGQDFFLRENLKLRVLNARLALLSRDQATFRSELKVAQGWLTRYFAGDDKGVQAALAMLGQLTATTLSGEFPNLSDSQAALRALRNGKEKR
ncbi:MAG: hypothetical protein D3M94_17720 [Rhodocyclales bacterium GT-UBC]|nr:MAG: hypothetical protein D3M94_17720 [Rhodocyclales bacterium GT-UBC]